MDRAGIAVGCDCRNSRQGRHALSAGLFGAGEPQPNAENEYCLTGAQCTRGGANCEGIQRAEFWLRPARTLCGAGNGSHGPEGESCQHPDSLYNNHEESK